MYFKRYLFILIVVFLGVGVANASVPVEYQRDVGGISLRVVELPAGSKVRVGLAHRGVGFVEALSSIAAREGANVAINGTFFEAYGGRPEPNNNIISRGKAVHVGDVGTTIGFFSDGSIKLAPVKIRIEGSTKGSYSWPNNWYAWGINHTPDSTGAYIFTIERGATVGFARGVSIVIANGRVIKKVFNEDVVIPGDGYVINFTGEEEYQAKLFSIGTQVAFRTVAQASESWLGVMEGLGAGPTLVSKGKVSVNPATEGFTEEKILSLSSARSAIGIKSDGGIVLVATPFASMQQLAAAMLELGVKEAMNLDGGASSGIWMNGRYLVEPGRNVSNALLFYTP